MLRYNCDREGADRAIFFPCYSLKIDHQKNCLIPDQNITHKCCHFSLHKNQLLQKISLVVFLPGKVLESKI